MVLGTGLAITALYLVPTTIIFQIAFVGGTIGMVYQMWKAARRMGRSRRIYDVERGMYEEDDLDELDEKDGAADVVEIAEKDGKWTGRGRSRVRIS